MSFKLHLILASNFRCNFLDIPYLSETQKNPFQFLNNKKSLNNSNVEIKMKTPDKV